MRTILGNTVYGGLDQNITSQGLDSVKNTFDLVIIPQASHSLGFLRPAASLLEQICDTQPPRLRAAPGADAPVRDGPPPQRARAV